MLIPPLTIRAVTLRCSMSDADATDDGIDRLLDGADRNWGKPDEAIGHGPADAAREERAPAMLCRNRFGE